MTGLTNEAMRPKERATGKAKQGDNHRRLAAECDALMRLCDAQRRKIERQAAEINRLRARLGKVLNEQSG